MASPTMPSSRTPIAAGTRRRSAASARMPLLAMKPKALLRQLAAQSPAFWLVSIYLFFEYVRPQTVYPSLDILPMAKIALVSGAVLVLAEGRISFAAPFLWAALATWTAVIVASSITALYPEVSWDAMSLWVNWLLLIFVVGAGIRNRTELILLLLQWILWNLKMSQHGARAWIGNGFSFDAWGVSGAPGWFQNSGEFGIEMCVFFPILGYFAYGAWPHLTRNRRLIAIAIAGSVVASIIASSSRGAFFGLAVISAWIALRSKYRVRISIIAAAFIGLVWMLLPEGNKARWRTAGDDRDSRTRIQYWKDGIEITNDYPLLGIGYQNWIPYYRARYNPKGEVPHNYLVEAGSQLGYSGLIVFVVMTGLYFGANARVRRLTRERGAHPDRMLWSLSYGLDGAMIGFLASGFFVTVLFYPYYWMNLALSLALSRVADAQRVSSAKVRKRPNIPQASLGPATSGPIA